MELFEQDVGKVWMIQLSPVETQGEASYFYALPYGKYNWATTRPEV